MPKGELTAGNARTIAELAEDRALDTLVIRPRLSGKNKGKLFAEWTTVKEGEADLFTQHSTVQLVETLEDVADRIEFGKPITELDILKNTQGQFIRYVRGE